MKTKENFLIIKTDSYVGNFEIELLAYITGISVNRGLEFAEIASKELKKEQLEYFKENLIIDYYGIEGMENLDICHIFPSEHFISTDCGQIFPLEDGKNIEKMKLIEEKYIDFHQKEINERIKYFEILIKNETNEKLKEEIRNRIKTILDSINIYKEKVKNGSFIKYPAYTDIIFKLKNPYDKNIINLIKERCQKFFDIHIKDTFGFEGKKVNFLGIDLLVKEENKKRKNI